MKMKVLDVVTMAGNDHRVSLENDDLKIDIQFKSYEAFAEVDFKRGDEIENLFQPSAAPGSDAEKDALISALREDLQSTQANHTDAANRVKELESVIVGTQTSNAFTILEMTNQHKGAIERKDAEITELKNQLKSINPAP